MALLNTDKPAVLFFMLNGAVESDGVGVVWQNMAVH